MGNLHQSSGYIRRHFGYNDDSIAIPSLTKIYTESFRKFLQHDRRSFERALTGLESSLRSVFPLELRRVESVKQRKKSADNKIRDIYYYSHYIVHPPIHSEEECKARGLSHLCSVYIVAYKHSIKGSKNLSEFSQSQLENNINLFEKNVVVFPIKGIPYMTSKGTFIINGIERAVVSQLQRSPGLYYSRSYVSKASEVKLIPYYGNNLMIERNLNDRSYVRVGGKRRIPLHTFLLSVGFSPQEILIMFYNPFSLWKGVNFNHINFNLKNLLHGTCIKSIKDARSGKTLIHKRSTVDEHLFLKILGSKHINSYLSEFGLLSTSSGLKGSDSNSESGNSYLNTMINDNLLYRKKMLESVQSSLASRVHSKDVEDLIFRNYIDPLYFNLSYSGRTQINESLHTYENEHLILTKIDIISLVQYLYKRERTELDQDSVYHIQNRKVRLPGEILNYLIFKSLLALKQRKEYSYRDNLNLLYENMYAENKFPKFFTYRIGMIFHPADYVDLKLHPKFLDNYLFHKIYQLTHVEDKIYQVFLVNTKKEIDSFITSSNLSQLLDQVNPIASLTHLRRLSLLGPEGLQRDNVSMDTRDVQSSFFGRICPIETPEGKSVGIVNSLTIYSRVSPYGDILSPYAKVCNKLVSSTVHMLDARAENDYYIALSSECIDLSNNLKNGLVYCKHAGEYKYVEPSLVDYIDISPRKILSISSSLIPYIEHNDGNRALMGANMQRQAVVNLIKESPISGTGVEIFAMLHGYLESHADSTLASMDSRHMMVSLNEPVSLPQTSTNALNIDYNLSNIPSHLYTLKKFEKNNQKGYDHHNPSAASTGTIISKGSLIADHTATLNKDVSIGHNILVGFTSMNGYSFEDSIVVSDRLLKDELYSSLHTKEFVAFDWDTFQSKERITRHIPYMPPSALNQLDSGGIVRTGTKIRGGDIVVGKILVDRRDRSVLSERDKFLQEILAGNGVERDYIKDTSERIPSEIEGVVLQVKKFFFSDTTIPELFLSHDRDNLILNYLKFRYKSSMLKNHVFMEIGRLIFGSSSFNGSTQGLIDYLEKLKYDSPSGKRTQTYAWLSILMLYIYGMPRFMQTKFVEEAKSRKIHTFLEKNVSKVISWNEDRLLQSAAYECTFMSPTEISKMRMLIIAYFSIQHSLKLQWFKSLLIILSKIVFNETAELPIRLVKILVGYRHRIKSGDKMTGRHGNKGVISKVVPVQDMPYMQDGTPLDIILNPIGISSRMNLGQVFEVYFGMSSLYMSHRLYSSLRSSSTDNTYQDIRQVLYHLYGHSSHEVSIISKLSPEELLKLSTKLSRAVFYSSSSFDGASLSDSEDMSDFSNIVNTLQCSLIDPYSGEQFDRKVTVGLMYILKLNHLVDEKMHARFTGPYNRVTEQPLGGKSLEGGQRFGEMEVWALQAYGAAYTLLDMLTVKSDLKSRSNIVSRKVKQSAQASSAHTSDYPSTDFPEAFNVLLREIWCLGLNLHVDN